MLDKIFCAEVFEKIMATLAVLLTISVLVIILKVLIFSPIGC